MRGKQEFRLFFLDLFFIAVFDLKVHCSSPTIDNRLRVYEVMRKIDMKHEIGGEGGGGTT